MSGFFSRCYRGGTAFRYVSFRFRFFHFSELAKLLPFYCIFEPCSVMRFPVLLVVSWLASFSGCCSHFWDSVGRPSRRGHSCITMSFRGEVRKLPWRDLRVTQLSHPASFDLGVRRLSCPSFSDHSALLFCQRQQRLLRQGLHDVLFSQVTCNCFCAPNANRGDKAPYSTNCIW